MLPIVVPKGQSSGETRICAAAHMHPAAIALGVVLIAAGAGLSAWWNHPVPAIAGAFVGIYLMFALQVAAQWEKAIVLRMGRFAGL